MSIWKKYGYTWVTLGLFLLSLAGHWLFAWPAYVNESRAHREPPQFSEYFVMTMRDMLENWQSEFLQLIWQVAGLSFLLHIGSAQSKEGEERLEEKVDLLLQKLGGSEGERLLRELDRKYPRK
jgi:hypothetical protein